jgi:vitamin B12 transporter
MTSVFRYVWGVLFVPFYLMGQDTRVLPELTIRAIKPEHFMVGQKVMEVDSAQLSQNRFASLSDFLQFQTPVAIKSYGAGQLATISFRGTSANHTALLWNGVNVNFPSLGLSDLSTLPLAGFDRMLVQHGSAASVVGSDAVGGSILLSSEPQFSSENKSFHIGLRAESVQNFGFQSRVRFTQKISKWGMVSSKSLLYGHSVRNHFGEDFISDRKGRQYAVETMRAFQKGVIQDLFWQLSNADLLTFNVWLAGNSVVLHPQVLASQEITNTLAYRVVSSYQHRATLVRLAYIRDITDFGRGEDPKPSHTQIDKFLARVEHNFNWRTQKTDQFYVKVGAEAVHYLANVDGYREGKLNETRFDLYALWRIQFNSKLSTALNFRQAFVSSFNPPFTPSFGMDYIWYERNGTQLSWLTSLGISYRVPTLNERYWIDLGNPHLKPEKGFNKETGLKWRQKVTNDFVVGLQFTAFHNLIDNWVYWNPDKGFRVENLQQVLAKGLEAELDVKLKARQITWAIRGQYSHTYSSQRKVFGFYSQDILGKQLVYIPRHTVASVWSAQRKQLGLTLQHKFNSRRHITFDHSGLPFPGYYLLNGNLSINKIIKKKPMVFVFQGHNITNTRYASIKKTAMPTRSFSISVLIHF